MFFICILSFLWGLMEGLWFFVIPDLIISYYAIRGVKEALASTFFVIFGALVAALLLYTTFNNSEDSLATLNLFNHFWSKLPGYYPAMLDLAQSHLKESGAMGLLKGPNSGIPYRFYLLQAFELKISLRDILLWTPAARLERIILAPLAITLLRIICLRYLGRFFTFFSDEGKVKKLLFIFILIYWTAIYIWYWGTFLPRTYGVGP